MLPLLGVIAEAAAESTPSLATSLPAWMGAGAAPMFVGGERTGRGCCGEGEGEGADSGAPGAPPGAPSLLLLSALALPTKTCCRERENSPGLAAELGAEGCLWGGFGEFAPLRKEVRCFSCPPGSWDGPLK
jgi:hypothetical protein